MFDSTHEKFAVPSPWLEHRGLSLASLARYGVFQYDNPRRTTQYKGKVLFPIRRFATGESVGYLAWNPNTAEGEPVFRFPRGVHKHLELFGARELREDAPIRVLYVVESPLCVMAFWQKGFPAVSPYGGLISHRQADIISELARGCVFLPDRDRYC